MKTLYCAPTKPTVLEAILFSAGKQNLGIVYEGSVKETDEFLSDDNVLPGRHWLQMKGPRDAAIHYVLSELIYCPDSSRGEVVYDLPDPGDIVKLLWCERKAVGFYSIKPNGPKIQMSDEMVGSGMPTLDTAFILPSYRRRGLGLSMLQDFVKCYPNIDLGFSYPISKAMWNALRKFLEINEELKRKFWQIRGSCEEGNKTLIWLCLKRSNSQANE